MAGYRFFNNCKVGLSELIGISTEVRPGHIAGRDVLAVIDGTSIGLQCKKKHPGRWQAMGVIDDNSTPGFYLYPCVLLDRRSGLVLGLADICIFTRPKAPSSKKGHRQAKAARKGLPFEHKESSVWSLVASNSGKALEGASSVTYVMDRGADIYDAIHSIADGRGHCGRLLVRAKQDREAICAESGRQGRLSELLGMSEPAGMAKAMVRGLCHRSKSNGKIVMRKGREAVLEVRYTEVSLRVPKGKPAIGDRMWIVRAKESACSIPEGERGIEWVLATTIPVDSLQDALGVIDCYRMRWWVEQLFRILKKDGIDIEMVELADPEAIKKYTVMALKSSLDALRLVAARDGVEHVPIEEMFGPEERRVLSAISKSMEGNTEKQKNPYKPDSLAWAAWVIARMGGWKGYQSQRPPGPTIMSRGLEAFRNVMRTASLIKDEET